VLRIEEDRAPEPRSKRRPPENRTRELDGRRALRARLRSPGSPRVHGAPSRMRNDRSGVELFCEICSAREFGPDAPASVPDEKRCDQEHYDHGQG
jgi:hypothetical protein